MWIGITLGDVTGIGPEITLKALAAWRRESGGDPETRFLILGDAAWLARANGPPGLPLAPFAGPDTSPDAVCWLDPRPEPLPATLPAGAAPAALAALDWLREGARRCLAGELAALVTAPVSKAAIRRAGVPFVGQTEFLAELAGTQGEIMMLLGDDAAGHWLRVALATTHLPLRQVADALTPGKIELAIRRAAAACDELGLPRARVGVCGLNPHAGEGGLLGREDVEVIAPAVAAARAAGLDAHGPLSADTLFHQAWRGEFDAVVAMYHDQGLAPLKLVAFDRGVNWTLGLPFVRTAPDHGPAYDLAGRDCARPDSMLAALRLAVRLARRRTAGRAPR
jgi:4-hydroxythreonine-4-phosphate dehydrogenase